MSIEAGARAGMIAPDQTTLDWLRGRKHVPANYEAASAEWLKLATDPGAVFDKEVVLDGAAIRPMATWGTTPDAGAPIGSPVPQPQSIRTARPSPIWASPQARRRPVSRWMWSSSAPAPTAACRSARRRRGAARPQGQAGLRMLVVPGSEAVRRDAEAEGLDQVFIAAGAEWRIPGCSMCIAMNGDVVAPGQLAVSTSNRNFEGRQGKDAPHHSGQPRHGGGDGGGGRADRSARLSERGGACLSPSSP